MIYLCIPISILLFHSVYSLVKQYLGKEPIWLKIYAMAALFFALITLALVVNDLLSRITSSGVIQSLGMLIIDAVILWLFVNKMPKKRIEE